MMHETDATSNKKGRKRRGPTRFPGINKDAKELGVNRATLYRMLAGYPGFKDLKVKMKLSHLSIGNKMYNCCLFGIINHI